MFIENARRGSVRSPIMCNMFGPLFHLGRQMGNYKDRTFNNVLFLASAGRLWTDNQYKRTILRGIDQQPTD